uniref:Uncharacterized protein n=1 Tax=viral metagenome TaxID=1070528 RepID=A0A6C0BT25_9ZZZZ
MSFCISLIPYNCFLPTCFNLSIISLSSPKNSSNCLIPSSPNALKFMILFVVLLLFEIIV